MTRLVAAALIVLSALALGGCRRAERVEIDQQFEQQTAASRAGLTLQRARGIAAGVAQVPRDEVTIMHRSAEGQVATILAAVPAAEGLLYEEARSPLQPESITEQTVETVDLRWDLEADRPLNVLWSERLQFAPRQPVTPEEAEAVAVELLDRWLPEEAPAGDPAPAQRLEAPLYVVSWVGMIGGHLTGDQVVVQVSAVTGLPISFSQRIAPRRPSPDEVEVTRDEALEIVREFLLAERTETQETINLVAQLSLSAERHPQAGPAWLVALVSPAGRQERVLTVDAMTGEVITRRARRRIVRENSRRHSEPEEEAEQ